MTQVDGFHARAMAELERNISELKYLNEKQEVFTRQMTEEEKAEIFGDNPNAIKNIGRGDGHEWSKYEDRQRKSLRT